MPDYVLPDLAYDYGALAPAISGEVMEFEAPIPPDLERLLGALRTL